jgi:hypothetical protein
MSLERNARVQARYDELTRLGKHGHYETMFQVVNEESARSLTEAAKIVEGWREADWPEGFDRATAEQMADDRARRIRAAKL